MQIFLCRHGNTFGPDQQGGERVFMCGSLNNIPLVESGRIQARNMAKYFVSNNIKPTAIYANHLIRTWEYAVIIKEYFFNQLNIAIPLYKDERLVELDYGNWSGLTKNEVINKFGQQAWDDWQNKRIIPNQSPHNWQMTREEITNNIHNFFADLIVRHHQDETILAIGSQGSITFVNELFDGGMEQAIKEDHYKIKTGRFTEINYDNKWNLIKWNEKP